MAPTFDPLAMGNNAVAQSQPVMQAAQPVMQAAQPVMQAAPAMVPQQIVEAQPQNLVNNIVDATSQQAMDQVAATEAFIAQQMAANGQVVDPAVVKQEANQTIQGGNALVVQMQPGQAAAAVEAISNIPGVTKVTYIP